MKPSWIPPTGHAVGLKTNHAILVIKKTLFLEFSRHLLVGNTHSLLHKSWRCGPEGILIEAIVHVPQEVFTKFGEVIQNFRFRQLLMEELALEDFIARAYLSPFQTMKTRVPCPRKTLG